jgi:hypothetical protein
VQIDRRFADYAFTGGFYFICQAVLLWALGYWPGFINQLQELVSSAPAATSVIGSLITGLAGVLGLIAVFVCGLLLDLAATFLQPFEMVVFRRHLSRNSHWLVDLIENNKHYCGSDYEALTRKRPPKPFSGSYQRLWGFFTSYITVQSSGASLTIMMDHYSLWRTGRSIAIAIYIVMFQFSFLAMKTMWFNPTDFKMFVNIAYEISIFVGFAIIWCFTLGTYSRLCFTLFSLLYVTFDKQQAQAAPEANS